MDKKKEIIVKKSLISLILKSIIFSILTLFIVQHFGKISGGGQVTDGSQENYGIGRYLYIQPFKFENPINGQEYYEYRDPTYGIQKGRKETYWLKLKEFYIPSLFYNISHIVVGAFLSMGILTFFKNYRFHLT